MVENYYFRRLASKFIDLLVAASVATFLSMFISFLGVLIGAGLILFSDGLGGGAGLAKRFFGIRVGSAETSRGGRASARITWGQSVLRNFPFCFLVAVCIIPVLGPALSMILGLPYCIFEIYLFFSVTDHLRLGDVLAQTVVLDTAPAHEKKAH